MLLCALSTVLTPSLVRPERHFCTLDYTQTQPPFRQRFPLCFPESVCRKSMAVDLESGPRPERVTQGKRERVVRRIKMNIDMANTEGQSQIKRRAGPYIKAR